MNEISQCEMDTISERNIQKGMHPVFYARQPTQGASLPSHFSFSSLRAIEICPRRWWLLHSHYADLKGNYPQTVSDSSIRGTIVHNTLERLGKALKVAGSPTPGSGGFLAVLREFQPRSIILQERQKEINALASNPRVHIALLRERIGADACLNAFKRLFRLAYGSLGGVDTVLPHLPTKRQDFIGQPSASSTDQTSTGSWRRDGSGADGQVPCPAFLPEQSMTLDQPPLMGQMDLVETDEEGDRLTEYKTGKEKPEHEQQLRFYTLLWWRQTGRLFRWSRILYADQEPKEFAGLTLADIQCEEVTIQERVNAATHALQQSLPPAIPQVETCMFCPVRQLCADYWTAPTTIPLRLPLVDSSGKDGPEILLRDMEIVFTRGVIQNGELLTQNLGFPLSLPLLESKPVRMSIPPRFLPGDLSTVRRVRLLGVALHIEMNTIRVQTTIRSEVFWAEN